jgi:hypothetical protein
MSSAAENMNDLNAVSTEAQPERASNAKNAAAPHIFLNITDSFKNTERKRREPAKAQARAWRKFGDSSYNHPFCKFKKVVKRKRAGCQGNNCQKARRKRNETEQSFQFGFHKNLLIGKKLRAGEERVKKILQKFIKKYRSGQPPKAFGLAS